MDPQAEIDATVSSSIGMEVSGPHETGVGEPVHATAIRGAISAECISDVAGFRALRDDWKRLFSSCPDRTPFTSWEWLFSWWLAYGRGRPLRILAVRSDNKLVGLAPLYLDNERTHFRTTCRVLRLVGDGSLDSDHLDFVVAPAHEAAVRTAFGEWLGACREWDAIALRELTGGTSLNATMRELAMRLDAVFASESAPSAVLDLPASFDSFLKERQSRFRTRIRSLLRRVDHGEFVFEYRCEPRELKRKLRSLFALHQQRWSAAGRSGVFAAAARRIFYAHFATRFARNGWLRLYSLRRDNRYVAHQLCFGHEGTTYLLQEGFDVTDASASYGQMLRASVIRHLIDTGERRYDFLAGFSQHKEEWGAGRTSMLRIILARRTFRGWSYLNAPVWRERLANTAKRVLPPVVIEHLRRARSSAS
jgi:CelD/BcsL family acetyltransferase involved in cellulose biosynthesis